MIKKLLLLNCLLAVVVVTTSKKAQAQNKEKKEVKTSIIINDGDTTVNGKKFKNLNEEEKAELRKEFNGIKRRKIFIDSAQPGGHHESRVMIVKDGDSESLFSADSMKIKSFTFKGDGKPMVFEMRRDSLLQKLTGLNMDREIMINRNFNSDIDWEMVHPKRAMPARPSSSSVNGIRLDRPNLPNSNTFNYSTTDKDGFTTRVAYSIAEPSLNDLKNTFKDDKINSNGLNISDVMLVPNFTSGKTTLTFSSKTKGVLTVKMIDSSGSTVFTDSKTLVGETYSNSFSASKNGNYFLQITQGSQTFIRKVTLVRN